MVTITDLWVYPVKSLRGFSISSSLLSSQGLTYDRHWMVIDDNNHFVTQRKFSQMILIHTRIDGDQLILSKPSEPSLGTYSIQYKNKPIGDSFSAIIWKDTCQVYDEGKDVSDWLTQALGTDKTLRLVRMAETKRTQNKAELLIPELQHIATDTFFADVAPFLVANRQSLNQVNEQMLAAGHSPVTIEHFRPNIVVDNVPAFAEHKIQYLTHSDYQLRHCYPCQRCVIPTIDLETGQRHSQQQPFSLVAQLNAMPDKPKAPAFGENAVLSKGQGQIIKVGDNLNVEYKDNSAINNTNV